MTQLCQDLRPSPHNREMDVDAVNFAKILAQDRKFNVTSCGIALLARNHIRLTQRRIRLGRIIWGTSPRERIKNYDTDHRANEIDEAIVFPTRVLESRYLSV